MVICKFFLEGRCRYGNNCYNEHVLDNRFRYNKGGYSQNKKWETGNSTSYDYEEYDYDDQYQSDYRKSNNSFNRGDYSWHASSYDRDSNYDYYPSHYDDNFNKSNKPKSQTYNSGTSFSFSLSENRFDALSEPKYIQETTSTPQDNADLDNIKEDMVTWKEGKCWPFSCYSPSKEHSNFPGFNDVSPEELRWKAYEAKENNDFSSYVQSVNEAMKDVDEKRNLLKNPTSATIQNIKNNSDLFQSAIQTNQPSSSFSSGASSFSFKKAMAEGNGFNLDHSIENAPKSASSFSFKKAMAEGNGFNLSHLIENASKSNLSENVNDVMITDNSSSFSFQLPVKKVDFSFTAASAKTKVPEKGQSYLYTPLLELTDEEKEAFTEPVFTLGKIPTRPPPKELCFS